MSKRVVVKPEWLDDLLRSWGRKSDRMQGWYSISPMLADGIPQQTNPLDVGGYISVDYSDLELAIGELEFTYRLLIVSAFKPWHSRKITAGLIEMHQVSERTLQNWVHDAARILAEKMKRR